MKEIIAFALVAVVSFASGYVLGSFLGQLKAWRGARKTIMIKVPEEGKDDSLR